MWNLGVRALFLAECRCSVTSSITYIFLYVDVSARSKVIYSSRRFPFVREKVTAGYTLPKQGCKTQPEYWVMLRYPQFIVSEG